MSTRRHRLGPVPDRPCTLEPLGGVWTSEGRQPTLAATPDPPIPVVVAATVLGLAALAGSLIGWAGSALYDRLTGGHQ